MKALTDLARWLISAAILVGIFGAAVYGGFELLNAIAQSIHYRPHA